MKFLFSDPAEVLPDHPVYKFAEAMKQNPEAAMKHAPVRRSLDDTEGPEVPFTNLETRMRWLFATTFQVILQILSVVNGIRRLSPSILMAIGIQPK